MTVSRCIFVLGWLKTWGQWHPLPSTQCPLLAREWDCRICVAFRILLRDRTQFLRQPFKPDRRTASSPAGLRMFETASGIDSKNITSEEKIRKWPTRSPFLEAGPLAGDQSYALRPNLSAASVCESPQIPILKNVGLEAKLIKTAKLKLRKCNFFNRPFPKRVWQLDINLPPIWHSKQRGAGRPRCFHKESGKRGEKNNYNLATDWIF